VRKFSLARGNLRKVVAKLGGCFRPPNMVVLVRNATDVSRSRRPTHPQPVPGPALDWLIRSAVGWICHSQDVVGSGGVGSYDFSGWSTGYPEVTGYIIPTMWDCAQVFERDNIAERAVRMTDWALGIQHPQGGWEGGNQGDGLPPLVFNTGQVMRGLLRTHRETGEERWYPLTPKEAEMLASKLVTVARTLPPPPSV